MPAKVSPLLLPYRPGVVAEGDMTRQFPAAPKRTAASQYQNTHKLGTTLDTSLSELDLWSQLRRSRCVLGQSGGGRSSRSRSPPTSAAEPACRSARWPTRTACRR